MKAVMLAFLMTSAVFAALTPLAAASDPCSANLADFKIMPCVQEKTTILEPGIIPEVRQVLIHVIDSGITEKDWTMSVVQSLVSRGIACALSTTESCLPPVGPTICSETGTCNSGE